MSVYEGSVKTDQGGDRFTPWSNPAPFGSEAIQFDSGVATSLRVVLSFGEFNLPRLDVGPPDKLDTIFYLNISPDPESENFTAGLYEAAVTWFTEQIITQGIRVLVIPPSHKSTEALREAVLRANQIADHKVRIIELVGGKKQSDVASANPNLTEHYIPITTPLGKYIGMKGDDAAYLYKQAEVQAKAGQTFDIWIGDDVVSTGETLKAINKILKRATDDQADVYVLVIAIEAPEELFPPQVDSHTMAAMSIVEIKGGIKDAFVSGEN